MNALCEISLGPFVLRVQNESQLTSEGHLEDTWMTHEWRLCDSRFFVNVVWMFCESDRNEFWMHSEWELWMSPECTVLHRFWLCPEWLWMSSEWHLHDSWKNAGWVLGEFWISSERLLNELWIIPEWLLSDFWRTSAWVMKGLWMAPEWVVNDPWTTAAWLRMS